MLTLDYCSQSALKAGKELQKNGMSVSGVESFGKTSMKEAHRKQPRKSPPIVVEDGDDEGIAKTQSYVSTSFQEHWPQPKLKKKKIVKTLQQAK